MSDLTGRTDVNNRELLHAIQDLQRAARSGVGFNRQSDLPISILATPTILVWQNIEESGGLVHADLPNNQFIIAGEAGEQIVISLNFTGRFLVNNNTKVVAELFIDGQASGITASYLASSQGEQATVNITSSGRKPSGTAFDVRVYGTPGPVNFINGEFIAIAERGLIHTDPEYAL